MQIPLIKGDKVNNQAEWTDALPVNMYVVTKPILGADGYFASYPGLDVDSIVSGFSVTAGSDRGAIWVEVGDPTFDGHYRVLGQKLCKVDNTLFPAVSAVTAIGDIPGNDLVSMAYSFNNLAIVADGNLWYYNPTAGLRQITDPEVGSPIDITWGQNLFILTDGDVVYHSDPLDEENFLPLDFTVPEFRPDPSLGVSVNEDSELLVFGTLSVEHFVNVGATNFVYRPLTQKAQKIGVVGTRAKKAYGNTYFMVGRRDTSSFGVYITESGVSQKVSSIAIDRILANYSAADLKDTIIDVLTFDGVTLCVITLKDRTLCLNWTLAESKGVDLAWSELTSPTFTDTIDPIPHDGFNYVYDQKNKAWLCGDRRLAVVLRLSTEKASQLNRPQEHILYSPLIKIGQATGGSPSIDELEIETIPGYGIPETANDVDKSSNMFVSLTYNGVTYGKEWSELYGQLGNHGQKYIIRRLGIVRDIVGFKFRSATKYRMALAFFSIEVS